MSVHYECRKQLSRKKATRCKKENMKITESVCSALESKTSSTIKQHPRPSKTTKKSVNKSYMVPFFVKQFTNNVLITAHHWRYYR